MYVLDAIANAVAGRSTDAGAMVLDWACPRLADAGRRAFALGALTHIVEMDDLHRASVTHPGCVVVPAVAACAADSNAGGHAILRAVLHGYEACARVGMAVGAGHYKIWHNTSTCGPFGSAMATASLLGLDEKQTLNALGNAGTQSSGVWQFLDTAAMSKHLHAGRAAESGILAAQLASRGFTGPAYILEGEKGLFAAMCVDPVPEAIAAAPDTPWQLHQTSIKPWPSCRHTHPVIDTALGLAEQVEVDAIDSVEIQTYQAALDVCNLPRPQSGYAAKFSLQHCVIAALAAGRIDFGSFEAASRNRFAALTEKVMVIVGDDYEAAYPQAWGAAVRVRLSSGQTLAAQCIRCKGDPDRPVSRDELIDKARMLMEYGGMDQDHASQLCKNILDLSDDKALDAGLVTGILA